ncbi:MAG: trypsin-like peptidase domain-containing protein [Planctomycetes bacterium]|nr:trypsin-like peptidase domain-containing protein [Planctomycetota bacterium]
MRNQVISYKFQVIRLLILLVLGIALIGLTARATKPMEMPPDVIIIRPMDKANNPYQREYDEMLKPVVMITALSGRGTGVIIPGSLVHQSTGSLANEQLNNSTNELYILTAAHVVGNYSTVTVTVYAPLCELSAFVVMTDTNKDLALLKIRDCFANARNDKTARLAPSDYTYYLFTPVYVVGCSLGLNPRPSSGIISSISAFAVEITAPVLPGNSGGPVYDAGTHELIGIAVWVRLYGDQLITTMAGVVPISEIYVFLESYKLQVTSFELEDETYNLQPETYFLTADEPVIGDVHTNQGDRLVSLTKRPRTAMGSGLRREVNNMGIVSKVDLWIPANVPPSPDMEQKWNDVLQTVATLINDRRNAKIPDEAAFQNKVVEASNQAWANVISSTYRSKSGKTYDKMKNAHDANLQQSYNQWNEKLNRMFESVDGVTAKRFKDIVSFAKKFWTETVGKGVLRLTGDKVRGQGAATIATYWLTGEPMAAGMVRPQDTGIIGGPYRVCRIELVQALKAALMNRLVQAGMVIFNSQLSMPIITEENTTTNTLIQGFIDPALGLESFTPGGASHLDFVKQGALLKLSLQVSQV